METKQASEEIIEKALTAIDSCNDYFNTFARENGKTGFVWIEHNETGQLVVYTRGEYTQQILEFLSTLK